MTSEETLSSLFEAIKIGDNMKVDTILQTHPSWIKRTLSGCTLLEAAVHCVGQDKSLGIIKELLKSGVNVNQLSVCFDIMDGSETPLIAAARKCCSTDLVRCLIEAGARVNTIDGVAQLSALSYTCCIPANDHNALQAQEIAKALLENGAEVNGVPGERSPPLHLAVNRADNLATVKLLASHGADVNLTDSDYRVPLQGVKSFRVAEFLVKSGACIMPETRHWLLPVEEILASCDRDLEPDKMRIVCLLISHGASLNIKVIPEVCWFPYRDNIELFIKSGALQLHPPWRNRGVVCPATERSKERSSYFRRQVSDGFVSQLRRFPNPFWNLDQLLSTGLPKDKYVFLSEHLTNPTCLRQLCNNVIRHCLLENSHGKSIVEMIYKLPGPKNLKDMIALKDVCGIFQSDVP